MSVTAAVHPSKTAVVQSLTEVVLWLQMSMTPKGPCQSGYYCPNSSAIIPCPPGQFCKWWTKEPKVSNPVGNYG